MFCVNCGARIADDSKFCPECGAILNGGQVINNSMPGIKNTKNKNKKVGVIAVAVVAIAVIALIIGLFGGGRGYKSTVNKFLDAEFSANAAAIVRLLPDEVIDYILEEEGYDDDELKLFIEDMDEEIEDELDYLEKYLGEDFSVSWEILSVDAVTGRDMKNLKDDYEDNFDIEISAAKIVEVELTIEVEDIETSNTMEIGVIKVGRSWYLDIDSVDDIF